MEALIPWTRLVALIEPHYPKVGNGRRPYPLESMRRFSHLYLDQAITDHTTVIKFRHLLDKHALGRQIFDTINQYLKDSGLLMKEGSSIDATIIEAPCSTKNKLNQRDPEMHQMKKGNHWHESAYWCRC